MKRFFTLSLLFILTNTINAQWVQTNGPGSGSVSGLATNGNNIITSDGQSIYLSINQGETWVQIEKDQVASYWNSLAFSGNYILGSTSESPGKGDGGVYFSDDNGTNWYKVWPMDDVHSFAVSGNNVFANYSYYMGPAVGVIRSLNNGQSWSYANDGLTNITQVNTVAAYGDYVFAGTDSGIFISTNSGTNWTTQNNDLSKLTVYSIAASGTNVFAGTEYDGVYFSTDNGLTWTQVNNGLTNLCVKSLAISGTNIYAGTGGSGVFVSTNNGASWVQSINGAITNVSSFAFSNNNILAATNAGVGLSTNNGTNWIRVGLANALVEFITLDSNYIYACSQWGGTSRASLNSLNWETINNGITSTYQWVSAIGSNGKDVFAGTPYGFGIFHSTNFGDTWIQSGLTNVTCFYDFYFTDSNIFTATYNGLYLSTNIGSTWTKVNNGLPTSSFFPVYKIAASHNNVYIGTGNGVYISSDNGTSWKVKVNDFYNNAYSIAVCDTNIFVATEYGIFLSTNNGDAWTPVNNGLPTGDYDALVVIGTNIFTAKGYNVFLTTDFGSNWTDISTGLANFSVYSLIASKDKLFAGTWGGGVWERPLSELTLPVELSSFSCAPTDKGIKLIWTTVTEINNYGFYVERSFDKKSWNQIGFVKGNGNSIVSNNYTFVDNIIRGSKISYRLKQVDENGTVKYSGIIESNEVVNEFILEQNYPNPFNPTTTINYSLPKAGNVKLTVYNAIGSKVATIVNEYKTAGIYFVQFNGSNLASGIYLYRLESGNFSSVKKFIFLK